MDFIEFRVGPDDLNRRADKVIKKIINHQNLSSIYKAIRKNLIKINDKKIKPEQLISHNDVIKIASFLLKNNDENQNQTDTQITKTLPLPKIIFQNEDILFINKPYNTLVQKACKNDVSLDDLIKQYYKENQKNTSLSFMPGPLHRLDKNTTGILAFSWSLKGAHWFSKNMQNHNIKKNYIGIVQGNLKEEQVWKDTINKEYSSKKSFQTVKIQTLVENNAHTIITPLKHGVYKNQEFTVVQFQILTGKTHQIRSQSAFHGFPLLGDSAYNAKKQDFSREYFLHAKTLFLPENNELCLPSKIESPLFSDMQEFINTYS